MTCSRSTQFSFFPAFLFFLAGLLLLPPIVSAQWERNGTTIFEGGMGDQDTPDLVADQEGGCWAVWTNYVGGLQLNTFVQHFDAQGYRAFGDAGLAVNDSSRLYDYEMVGAVPDADGGVVVFHHCAGGSLPDGFSVYAQRINQAGERLWGPTGIPVIRFPEDQVNWQWARNYTTDDAGGGWVLSERRGGSPDLYLQGINADGSLKMDAPRDIGPGTPYGSLLERDGMGGVYVKWLEADDHAQNEYVTHYQHFDAAGVPIAQVPATVDVLTDNDASLVLLGPERGCYSLIPYTLYASRGYWNRIRPDLSLLMPDAPYVDYGHYWTTSNPVVMGNGDILWYACGGGYTYRSAGNLVRIDSTGSPYYATDTVSVQTATDDYPTANFCTVLANQPRDKVFIFHLCEYRTEDRTRYRRIVVENVDSTATDLWNRRTLHDYMQAEQVVNHHVYSIFTASRGRSVLSSDGDAFMAVRIDNYRTYHRVAALWKVFADGRVAGRDTLSTSVPDSPPKPLASDFRFDRAYPNPFNDTVVLNYTVPTRIPSLTCTIVNIQGRVVHQVTLDTAPGHHRFTWQPIGAASGIYFAILKGSEETTRSLKLVYLR